MIDIVFVAALVIAFATAITCHVTLAVGLARRRSLLRGLLALLVPPLALVWGFANRMWVRSVGLVLGVAFYAFGFLVH